MRALVILFAVILTPALMAGPGGGGGGLGGGIFLRQFGMTSERPTLEVPINLVVSAQDSYGEIHPIERLVEIFPVQDHKIHLDLTGHNSALDLIDLELVDRDIIDLNDLMTDPRPVDQNTILWPVETFGRAPRWSP